MTGMMIMNRREFLVRSGTCLAGATLIPLMISCSGEVRRQFSLQSERGFLGDFLHDDEILILHLASLAPSGHNAQPWTVTVLEPHRFIIGSDKDRWLPAVDPDNRELLLSIGAFLENLIVAARYYGYQVSYKIVAKDPKDTRLLDVRLERAQGQEYPLERITSRRTVRSSYLDRELSPEDVKYLAADTRYVRYFPFGTREADLIASATMEANRKQAYRDAAQEELARWIRWSDRDAREFRNGLTPAGMEIRGIANWYVRHFYSSQTVMKESFRQTSLEMVAQRITSGAGWITISSDDSQAASLIETGRRFEKMFLLVKERKIGLYPMTQALEEEPWRFQIAQELGIHMPVQFIVKVGYVDAYPSPVSLRMPVKWFIYGA
jgi:hypothetical protein